MRRLHDHMEMKKDSSPYRLFVFGPLRYEKSDIKLQQTHNSHPLGSADFSFYAFSSIAIFIMPI